MEPSSENAGGNGGSDSRSGVPPPFSFTSPSVLPSVPALPPASSRTRSRSLGSAQSELYAARMRRDKISARSRTGTVLRTMGQRDNKATAAQGAYQWTMPTRSASSSVSSPSSATSASALGLPPRQAHSHANSRFNLPPSSALGADGMPSLSASPPSSHANVLGFELALLPDLGGRAQSASSTIRRLVQSQSATSSPHASDVEMVSADLLESGDIPIGSGDVLGYDSYQYSRPNHQHPLAEGSSILHPEGGLGSGVGVGAPHSGQQGLALDELDLALLIVKNSHERALALEQKLINKQKQNNNSNSTKQSPPPQSKHSPMGSITEEDKSLVSPNLPGSSPSASPSTSTPAASPSASTPGLSRAALPELTALTRNMERLWALLYRTKLSLSLSAVQLKRGLRAQFLADLGSSKGGDDPEVARWIASSAMSNLDLETAEEAASARLQPEELEHEVEEDQQQMEQETALPSSDSAQAQSMELAAPSGGTSTPASRPGSLSGVPPPIEPPSEAADVPLPRAPSFSAQAGVLSPLTAQQSASPSEPTSLPPLTPSLSACSLPSELGSARSSTPIVHSQEPNIAQLIGTGFNTAKRGSASLGQGAPGGLLRKSSTVDALKSGAAATAAAAAVTPTSSPGAPPLQSPASALSPQLLTRARSAQGTTPSSSSPSVSPALAPSGADASPVLSAPPHSVPLTALSLASEQTSHSGSRRGSHPSSPGWGAVTRLSLTPHTLSRNGSDNKPRDKEETEEQLVLGAGARRPSRVFFTLSPAILECLQGVWSWSFDIFAFVELCPQTPLSTMACYLLEKWGLFSTFAIDRATFHRFICKIEEGYLDVPYHNRVHAADVLQSTHSVLLGFIQNPVRDSAGAICTSLTPLDIFALLVSAAIHDYQHSGQTNLYHVNVLSDLAIRYNDNSVLENMHIAESFNLILRHKEYDILSSLSLEQKKEFRETVIQCVLATDMKHHISMLTDLQATVEKKKAGGVWFDVSSRSDRMLLLKNCLHLADVANSTKPTPACVAWAERIVAEWFAQGDMEREAGLPISPMMDRRNANVEKAQAGWIDFFIFPLFSAWAALAPGASVCLDYLKVNRAYWAAREEAKVKQQQKELASAETAPAAQDATDAPNSK